MLRQQFLTAGTGITVAAPSPVRSFHLRRVAVTAVTLHRVIRREVVRVPALDISPVGMLDSDPRIVFKRPVRVIQGAPIIVSNRPHAVGVST